MKKYLASQIRANELLFIEVCGVCHADGSLYPCIIMFAETCSILLERVS